ncbi:MAG: FAD-dependent oxidoreductase [Acholeplasmataceae bacterium]|jgi:NADPH-dependent 2,4-dienoyl-CoA reductase/sulfur reductase-like enzyme/rhodanese-related sulfurtransferase|nr:FAD-dependent oxidoreductase [Acholeplasmataceae bacterium]
MKDNKKKIIVIGGVAGGMSFATRYRRLNQDDDIIIFEKGPYVSFANCGLPYHISGEIRSRSALLVVREQLLKDRFRLDIRSNSEVISIDSENKVVNYLHNDELKTEIYDELVISTGAKPIELSIPGILDIPHFSLRNIPDLDKIMKFIKSNNPRHATIIGAGYIGLEVAENLILKGIDVTVVEKANEVLPIVDQEMAVIIREELERNGIKIITDNEISRFENNHAYLKSDDSFETDFVITAIGVLPDTILAKNANIHTGLRGGILVDKYFQTSEKNIYAVGDAILVKHQISGHDVLIPLASPANRQGRQLADILSGLNVTNRGTLGTSIVKIFNLSLASTGLNEKQLQGQDYQAIHLYANDHASYYPNATPIYLKVIFDPKTEKILGAQAVGEKGVDKRIDILATAIKGHIKVTDLQELELSYAPPFSSAKDIVNLAGYVSSNMILGLTKVVQWHEVPDLLKDDQTLFVDVRNAFEREAYGYIKNSIHLDIDQMANNFELIPKDKKIILYCDSGTRSYNAERFLRSKGYECYNLDGSFQILSRILKEYIHV